MDCQFDNQFNLDATAKRNLCNAECRSGVRSTFREYLKEQLGGAIRDEMLFDEFRR